MELNEKLINSLSDVWSAISRDSTPFSIFGIVIFFLGLAAGFWCYRKEVRVLRALHGVLEERIQGHQQENARLAAFLQPKTAEAFSAIHYAPSHRIDVPYPGAEVTARAEYRILLDLGMIRIEQIAPNQTMLTTTSEATRLWEAVQRNR
jgi:hypothetical protein